MTDRKTIARKYLTTYFIFEVFTLFPFSVFRYNSDDWPNEKNTIVNLRYLNFKSLPRLYQGLIFTKLVRVRKTQDYLDYCLNKITSNSSI